MHTLSERIARHLERCGWLVRDLEHDFLTFDASDDSILDELRSHSITYRIALGPHAGRKAFTLQMLASSGEFAHGAARANGFSLQAGVVAASDERDKLERLCRYITRPAVSTERLSLTAQGLIHYRLKTPYRDGTTQVVFEPLDLMAHILVRHPAGDLRSSKSALLPICHGQTGRASAEPTNEPHPLPRRVRAQSSSTRAGDTRASRSAPSDEYGGATRRSPRVDDMGTTPEAGVQD